ncbi:MAG: sulfotransferase family 2 domain-containing protein [Nitrospira sp.]|nr:sulfotransferase family 2 domain-containing protein [Nitrospira sp.]
MKYIILHHHFFKNAGSTLIDILKREFGEGFEEYHPSAESEGYFSDETLAGYLHGKQPTAISSHHFIGQNYNLSPFLNRQFRFYDFILVRHPLKRLASMYSYYQTIGQSNHPIAQVAQRSTLQEFLKFLIREHPNHVLSPQVCNLAGAPLPPMAKHLDEAIARLRVCAVSSTVEDFKAAMIAAEYFLKPVFRNLRLHYATEVNRSPRIEGYDGTLSSLEEVLGKTLFSTLVDMNALDIELCKTASFELESRTKQIPHYLELANDFESRCGASPITVS